MYRNGAGEPEGIAIYRIAPKWERGLSRTVLEILYFVHASEGAHAALWRQLLSLALVEKIVAPHAPVDEPLTWILVDGRRLSNTGTQDHIWLRILDLKAAFEQRASGLLSRPITLRVSDEQFGETRTYELAPHQGRVHVEESAREPDIETDVGVVGSLFLGGTRIHPLVAARRIRPSSEASLMAFAGLFAGTAPPFVDTEV